VPRLTVAVPDLNEAHSLFELPPCNQNLSSLRAISISFPNGFRLFRNIESVRGVHLHTVRKLKGLHARLHLGILRAAFRSLIVQLAQQVQLLPLFTQRDVFVFDVLDEFFNFLVLGIDVSALKYSRQESALPVLRLLNRITAWTHADES